MNIEVGKTYTNRQGLVVLILAALTAVDGSIRAYAVKANAPEAGDFFYEVNAKGEYPGNTSYDLVDDNERKFEVEKFYESETGKWIGTPLILNADVPGFAGKVNVIALYNVSSQADRPDIRVFQNNRSVVGSVVLYRGRETPRPAWLS